MLGNMYANMGQKEKAIAAYKKGLAVFPDNAHLKKQLASVEGFVAVMGAGKGRYLDWSAFPPGAASSFNAWRIWSA